MTTVLALLTLLTLPSGPGLDVIDRIMAVVGTRPITLSEVVGVLQFDLIPVPSTTPDRRGYALDRLIDRTLMLTEVDRFQPPEPDPIEITIRVDAMEKRAGSAAALERALAVTGMTRDQLRRFVRDSLRIDTYQNQRFGTLIDPTERASATASWIAELRRRAQITMFYRPAGSTRGSSR